MGTLYNQPPRKSFYVSNEDIAYMYKQVTPNGEKLTPTERIAVIHLLELRRQNDLYFANGDIHDEQLMGIGDNFQTINYHFESLLKTLGGDHG